MRELPQELPLAELPPREIVALAQAVLGFAWKRAGRSGEATARWCAPRAGWLGLYDQERSDVWLNVELARNEEELIATIGHEVAHAKQYGDGRLFDCKSAEVSGEYLLEAWERRRLDLHAKAAASGVAREPYQRRFFSGEPPADPLAHLAHLRLPTSPARAAYSFESRGVV